MLKSSTLANKTAILGLDIGDRRIGVAIAETATSPARPLLILPNNRAFVNELVKLRFQYHFDRIVVGLPYTLAGGVSGQAAKVYSMVEKIRAKLMVEIVLQDERLTTKTAQSKRREGSAGASNRDIDAEAAAVILQTWLDRESRK